MTNRRTLTPEQAVEIVKRALDNRYGGVDTAGAYARGLVEIALDETSEESTDTTHNNPPDAVFVNTLYPSTARAITVRANRGNGVTIESETGNQTYYDYLTPADARKMGEALINLAAWLERRDAK